MKKLFAFFSLTAWVVLFSGCSSNLVKESGSNAIKAPMKNMASIVFMRNAFTSHIANTEIFEIVDGKPKIIGALPNGTKFVYQTTPGRKVFMTYKYKVDFMIADLLPGKTYYSIVRPIYASGLFVPTPIRKSIGKFNMETTQFAEIKKETQMQELNMHEAQKWFSEKKEKIEELYKETWPRFLQKSENDLAQCTLNPQDGI